MRNTILAAATCLLGLASAAQAACDMSQDGYLLDWNDTSNAWNTGSSSGNAIARASDTSRASNTVSFSFTGDINRMLDRYPAVNATFNGSHRSRAYSLAYAVDYSSNSQAVFLTISFPQPVEGLNFEMLDVDSLPSENDSGGFRDGLKITGSGPSGSVMPRLAKDETQSTIYLGSPLQDNWALGYFYNASNGSDEGTLFINFDQPVSRVIIEYTNGIYPPSSNPSPQGVAVYDLNYCVPRPAKIDTTKTQKIFGETALGCDIIPGTPDPDAKHAIPGACIEYKINASNSGNGTANALTLTDRLNNNLIFMGASRSGFSSGGANFGLSTPPKLQDCSGGSCTISLRDARLDPGQSGEILIRALVK